MHIIQTYLENLGILYTKGGVDMVMSRIFSGMVFVSVLCAMLTGRGSSLAAAIPKGAQAGVNLAGSLAGSLCLWTGIGKLLEWGGVMEKLSRILMPLLGKIFPSALQDPELAQALSGNICANLLGLGNAATPMGIQAVRHMGKGKEGATDEMCRLIVLNTASIQLIPATVAAVRAGLGSETPFDILPAVWVTSLCSSGLGVAAAWFLGSVWKHD